MFFEEMDLHAVDQGCPTRGPHAGGEVVSCGPRCIKFVSRFFEFLVFFYRLKYICHRNTPKLYLLFLLWAYHLKTCITKASKICQLLRFCLHPYKLATLRATIGLIYHLVLSHKTYQNQGISYVIIAYCYVTKTFVARNKYHHVNVAHNVKRLGRPAIDHRAGPLNYFKQGSSYKSKKLLRSGHSHEIIQMWHVFDFSNKKI